MLIVKECGAVFEEIEEILRKSSKDGAMLDANFSLDRIGKIMWVFRKSRVQLLRGNLESLKSTILVELAVLNYADKVSSPIAYACALLINEVQLLTEYLLVTIMLMLTIFWP